MEDPRAEYTQPFVVNQSLLNSLDKQIVIMHLGPINRGVVLTSNVADSGRQSIILQQVENGVAIGMARTLLIPSCVCKALQTQDGITSRKTKVR